MISSYKCILWLWVLLGVKAAQADVALQEVSDDLRQRLQVVGDTATTLRVADGELRRLNAVNQFYAQRDYRPAWLNAEGPLPFTDAFLQVVADAEREGLRPADYRYKALSTLLNTARAASQAPLQQWTDLDLLFTDSWFTYATHLLSGRLNPQWAIKSRTRDLIPVLQTALEKGDIAGALQTLSPSHPGFMRLRNALADYREIARKGGWSPVTPGARLMKGVRSERVRQLRVRLQMTGDLAGELPVGRGNAEELFDENLQQAVRRFQRRHGIKDDGIVTTETLKELNVPVGERIRQIEANMERWRWLPDDMGQRHILVNVPDFSMAVIEAGRQVMNAKVIVGKSVRQTPVFTANMSYLVLSPRWYVPPTIAIKDKLPLLRKDAYALARQNIRIYDANGQEIDPGSVDWHTVSSGYFPYRLRQDPGPRNALGRVKFMFPNPYNVYLHDTPSQGLFSRGQRTFSSGCIRISKPIELAEYVLRDDPRWTREVIVSASASGRQRIVKLQEEIPVHVLYWTAWVDEAGAVSFRDDIYGRDKLLARGQFSI